MKEIGFVKSIAQILFSTIWIKAFFFRCVLVSCMQPTQYLSAILMFLLRLSKNLICHFEILIKFSRDLICFIHCYRLDDYSLLLFQVKNISSSAWLHHIIYMQPLFYLVTSLDFRDTFHSHLLYFCFLLSLALYRVQDLKRKGMKSQRRKKRDRGNLLS